MFKDVGMTLVCGKSQVAMFGIDGCEPVADRSILVVVVGLTAFLAAWLRLKNAELVLDCELVAWDVAVDGDCEICCPGGAERESLVIVSTLKAKAQYNRICNGERLHLM